MCREEFLCVETFFFLKKIIILMLFNPVTAFSFDNNTGAVCAWGRVGAGGLAASAWPQAQPRTLGWLCCIYFLTVVSKHKFSKVQLWFLLSIINPGSSFFPLHLVCVLQLGPCPQREDISEMVTLLFE